MSNIPNGVGHSLDNLGEQYRIDATRKVLLACLIGNETAGASGSKGNVFVHDNGQESFLLMRDTNALILSKEMIAVDEPDSGNSAIWRKGTWNRVLFAVEASTVIKLFSQSTNFGKGRSSAQYFIAQQTAAEILAIGRGVPNRPHAWVQGRLELITEEDFEKHGIEVPQAFEHLYSVANACLISTVSQARSAITKSVRGRNIDI